MNQERPLLCEIFNCAVQLSAISSENAFNIFGNKHIIPFLKQKNSQIDSLVDKLKFKEVCRSIGLPTVRVLRVFKTPTDFKKAWNDLPEKFVLKSNKASARNAIVTSKRSTSADAIMEKLRDWDAPYWNHRESHYNHTHAKLFAESYIDPLPADIKVVVVDHKPTILWCDEDRFDEHKRTVYKIENSTGELKRMNDCFWHYPPSDKKTEVERCVELGLVPDVLRFARALSYKTSLRMIRADFYIVENRIHGGEVTFASGNFRERISTLCADLSVGEMS